jgi:hypothetical protein
MAPSRNTPDGIVRKIKKRRVFNSEETVRIIPGAGKKRLNCDTAREASDALKQSVAELNLKKPCAD